ncbi:hypothetical protein Taro_023231, partial [Colocasia esculenta]|nr:hypothetical protein [Colocasia esculenta]
DKIVSEGFEVNTPGKTNSSNARSYNGAQPSEGMIFENANDAMTFYNTYGRNVGFGTCVISSKWKDGECIFRHLGCWRNGKSRRKAEAKNHRDSPKIGCNASVKVKVDKSSGKHVFCELIIEHNHDLNPGGAKHFRSHRKICTPQKREIKNMRRSGFEERWDQILKNYEECNDNEWMKSLYESRLKWAPVFLKDTFFAGMSSSQRSESIHHFFDGFVQSKTTLGEFIDKYSVALYSRYDAENEADVKTMETAPFL